jgi:hypothetical protein
MCKVRSREKIANNKNKKIKIKIIKAKKIKCNVMPI